MALSAESLEVLLLVGSALRVSVLVSQDHPAFGAALGLPALAFAACQALPAAQRRLWVAAQASGAKPSQAVSLCHGVLAIPCLLAALAVQCPDVWPLAWLTWAVGARMLVHLIRTHDANVWSFHPLLVPAVAYLAALAARNTRAPDPMGPQWWDLTQPHWAPFLGALPAPYLLEGLMTYMPRTFTTGEAMLLVQLAMAAATATITTALHTLQHSVTPTSLHHWFLSLAEPHAVSLFILTFTTLATCGLATLALVTTLIHNTNSTTPTAHSKQRPPSPTKRSSKQQNKPRNRVKQVSLYVSWGLLAMVGVATAILGAMWVLLVFLPGYHSSPTIGPIDSTDTDTSKGACIQGLVALAQHAQQYRPGQIPTLYWRVGVLVYWAVCVGLGLVLQSALVRPPQQNTKQPTQPRRSDRLRAATDKTTPPRDTASASDKAKQRGTVPLIIVRKGYHALALLLFAPVYYTDPSMLMVSLAIAWALLLALEACRALHTPLIGPLIHSFMSHFVDERDQGTAYVTHLALLLGLAGPLWLSTTVQPCACSSPHTQLPPPSPTTQIHTSPLAQISTDASKFGHSLVCVNLVAMSGIVSIGMGDAVASVVGCLFGRKRLHSGTKKTWEGTVGGYIAMLVCQVCLLYGTGLGAQSVSLALFCDVVMYTACTAALEALTHELDNFVVPLWHTTWMLVCVATHGHRLTQACHWY